MDDERKPIKIKKKYKKDSSFKSYYATGAIGGFQTPYDFRLAFYNVNTTNFILDTIELKQDEDLAKDEKIKKVKNAKMEHNILCEIVMTERAVREIYNFLGKELEELEERRKVKKEKEKK
ncbi:MAG: hypothetical protein ACOC44_09225 [Promethearchaeia archaeon]